MERLLDGVEPVLTVALGLKGVLSLGLKSIGVNLTLLKSTVPKMLLY